MSRPRQGEVWWAEHPDAGRRPFLVLSRQAAIPVLHSVLAVPATRTIRGSFVSISGVASISIRPITFGSIPAPE